MKIIYRLVYVILSPLYVVYMLFPPFWILNIPYWVITGRNLMKDFRKMYEV